MNTKTYTCMSLHTHIQHYYHGIAARWGVFLLTFFVVVFLSYAFLYVIDFIPEPVNQAEATDAARPTFLTGFGGWIGSIVTPGADHDVQLAAESGQAAALTQEIMPEPASDEVTIGKDATPNRIIIDALNKEIPVLNPQSRTIADLDAALLNGAVRHPDSADFKREGNMLILGHSSYLPNVLNRNFQAFNGIQELTWGDLIRLQSDDMEYIYRVERVYEALASEVVVGHRWGTPMLTLATCNTFGAKEDRFIVEASLISSQPFNP